MYRTLSSLIFFTVALIHVSADASMKRRREDDSVVLPKRIRLVLHEEPAFDAPQKHHGMFYCEKDHNCSYVTVSIRKINDHHELHNDPNAIPCGQCDYLCSSNRSFINHNTRWHAPQVSEKQLSIKPTIKEEKCGYCGLKGSADGLIRHMQVYHTPRFGRRSYNQSFPLKLQQKTREDSESQIILISSDSSSSES